jgi:3-isopropylmalate/(R)-2-methylmalate dehydratase small subunit
MDFANGRMTIRALEDQETFTFTISDFDRALVEAGGWVEYADKHY